MRGIVVYFLIINVIVFLLMVWDKFQAIRSHPRIPEVTLLCLSFAGGATGCLIGMFLVRHKIRKPRFSITIPILTVLQLLILLRYIQK